MGAVDQT